VTGLVRPALLVTGTTATGYGVLRLLELGSANLRGTLVWLVGGVVLHDAVFAPLVLVTSLVAVRFAPRRLLASAAVALVLLVPVTLLGIPELGRFGADPRNATLLDRHYWWGWSALVTLVVLVVAVGSVAWRRHAPEPVRQGGDDGARDGGR
jgi:hypothetical protein